MTLQALANLGELIAAIATVATLLYLAAQIRQNVELERSSQSQEHVRWRTELSDPLISDREVTALWMKGGEDFAELEPVDRQRLIFFESRAISGWSHYYHMRQKGLVDDYPWRELLHLIEWLGSREAMRAAWHNSRDGYEEGFRALMDRYVGPATSGGSDEDRP